MLKEREEELCDMFMMFDKDKSGTISVDELSRVMVSFGGLDKDELDIMIHEADSDNDGQVLKLIPAPYFPYIFYKFKVLI